MFSARHFLLAESILLSPFRIIFARRCFLQGERTLQKVLNFLLGKVALAYVLRAN